MKNNKSLELLCRVQKRLCSNEFKDSCSKKEWIFAIFSLNEIIFKLKGL